jgi:hypothetical protein
MAPFWHLKKLAALEKAADFLLVCLAATGRVNLGTGELAIP